MKALAIDLGGSHVTCALVEDGKVIARSGQKTDAATPLAPLLPQLAAKLCALAGQAAVSIRDCAGLAFGFCGLVDARSSRILSTNGKYDDAPGIDLVRWADREFGIPLRVENDARMALLGEWFAGAGRGFDNLVTFTLGTGVGGAAMMDGRLVRGMHAQAGCLVGHFPVRFGGRKCTCGNLGCAEAEASGWALPQICREWPGFAESSLAQGEIIDFRMLFECARSCDQVALEVKRRCLDVWSAVAVASVHAYDPEVVIYAGGVMSAADEILPSIQSFLDQHAWTPWGKVQVRAGQLGSDAALLGAIPLLREG